MYFYPKKGYHVSFLCLSCGHFSECFDLCSGGSCIYVSDDTPIDYEKCDVNCDFFIDKIEE